MELRNERNRILIVDNSPLNRAKLAICYAMKEDFMQHVFEPFMRSERVTKVEGTGLGLSITKGLVNLTNGTIQFTRKLHEGTTFTVELEFDAIDCKRHYNNETPLEKTNNILNENTLLLRKTILLIQKF